jgi:hypothetical protein
VGSGRRGLLETAAGGDRPDGDDRAGTDSVEGVVEMNRLVVVADVELEAVANMGRGGGVIEANNAVLGGEGDVDDAVEGARGWRAKAGADGFAAGIEDQAVRSGAADDLSEEGQCRFDGDAETAIDGVAKGTAARLDFGDAGETAGGEVGAGAAAGDDRDREAGITAGGGAAGQEGDGIFDGALAKGGIGDRHGVAFPGHQTSELKVRAGDNLAGKGNDGVTGNDTGAGHPDVDLDHGAEVDAPFASGLVQLADVVEIVDGDGDVGSRAGAEGGEAAGLNRADDLIGDQDVADAGGDEDFGLAELGTGDADGPGGKLTVGDGGTFVTLGVGAPGDVVGGEIGGDASDVAIHGVEIDEESGGIELSDGAADEGGQHGALLGVVTCRIEPG